MVDFTQMTMGQPLLSVLHFSSLSISGFVNCVIYGFNPLVRYKLKMKFCPPKFKDPILFDDEMHVNSSAVREFNLV